jgi:hypothetical protein
MVLLCREANAEALAQLEAYPPAPNGIPGRFRLDAQGHLVALP